MPLDPDDTFLRVVWRDDVQPSLEWKRCAGPEKDIVYSEGLDLFIQDMKCGIEPTFHVTEAIKELGLGVEADVLEIANDF